MVGWVLDLDTAMHRNLTRLRLVQVCRSVIINIPSIINYSLQGGSESDPGSFLMAIVDGIGRDFNFNKR